MMTNDYFEIGVITGAFGVRGEIKVFPTTDDPSRFGLLDEIFVETHGKGLVCYAIEKWRPHKNQLVLTLAGLDDADMARAMEGLSIKIPPDKALPLEDGQYFHRDLLDMRVFDEGGNELGVLTKIMVTGANDVYVIALVNAEKKGAELLLPAIKQCIIAVDVEQKRMTVRVLPGL